MSAGKEHVDTKTSDDVDPFLESVVRNAAGRSPEPKASSAKAGSVKQAGTKVKAGASKAESSPPPRGDVAKAAPETQKDGADDDDLMARVEAKLKAAKPGASRSVTIRMPGDLYERLTVQAWEIGERSLSKFVITILEEATQR